MDEASIRVERPGDERAIRELLRAAFAGDVEARLVDALRRDGFLTASLVAESDDEVIGYVAASPVAVEVNPHRLMALGIGPLAVHPERQRRGIGRRLMSEVEAHAQTRGADVLFVLGDPHYYSRLGYLQAGRFGFKTTFDAPTEAFLLRPLDQRALDRLSGTVRYTSHFDANGD